jgi:hypothetical protein
MTFLTSDELTEMQDRLERFLGLPEGDLTTRDFASRMRPLTYSPQDSTRSVSTLEITPSLKNQAALDIWRLLKIAETMYSDG